jgi:hypothetical protein
MCAVSNQFIAVGQQLMITNCAQDPSPITYILGVGAPQGTAIDTSGIFSWTPSCAQASTTNLITVWATDSYCTPLSNSVSFVIVVSDCLEVSVGSTVMQVGTTSSVPVSVISTLGLTNLSFVIAYPTNRFAEWLMIASNNAIGAIELQTNGAQTLLSLAAQPGQTLTGRALLGSLSFTALPGSSAFVPLDVTNVIGIENDGTIVGNSIGQPGRVVIIGAEPLLEAAFGSNSVRLLTLYGNPGTNYQLQLATNLNSPITWTNAGVVLATNLANVTSNVNSARIIFYRAVQTP